MGEVVGYAFSESGFYVPERFEVVLAGGARVDPGEFLYVEVDGGRVYYQAVRSYVRRAAAEYDEIMLKSGRRLLDEERNYPRVTAEQVGWFVDGRLEPFLGTVEPHSEVRRVDPSDLERLFGGVGGVSIRLGSLRPGGQEVRLRAWDLCRRGLVVFGGVGSGKTTTMLNVLVRLASEVRRRGGRPGILVVDKDGEYAAPLESELGAEVVDASGVSAAGPRVARMRPADLADYLRQAVGADRGESPLLRRAVLSTFPDPAAEVAYGAETLAEVARALRGMEGGGELAERVERIVESLRRPDSDSGGAVGTGEVVEAAGRGVVVLDLSRVTDWDETYLVLDRILRAAYWRALDDLDYGLLVAVDEAHLFASERGGVSLADQEVTRELRGTFRLISTTGPRNGIVPFVATQRPALVDKSVTTQLGQNVVAHRVEDVDLERVREMLGGIADTLRLFPAGRAVVKATAAPLPRPMVVDVDGEVAPASTGRTALDRWMGGG